MTGGAVRNNRGCCRRLDRRTWAASGPQPLRNKPFAPVRARQPREYRSENESALQRRAPVMLVQTEVAQAAAPSGHGRLFLGRLPSLSLPLGREWRLKEAAVLLLLPTEPGLIVE